MRFLFLATCFGLVSSRLRNSITKTIDIPLAAGENNNLTNEDVLRSVLDTLNNGIDVKILETSLDDSALKFSLGFKRRKTTRRKLQKDGDDENSENDIEDKKGTDDNNETSEKPESEGNDDDSNEHDESDDKARRNYYLRKKFQYPRYGQNNGNYFGFGGDSFEDDMGMSGFSRKVEPNNCLGLFLKPGIRGIGCLQNGCCHLNYQIDHLCPGTSVCCFSRDSCRQSKLSRNQTSIAPTTTTTIAPVPITTPMAPATPVASLQGPLQQSNCTGQVVQGYNSIGCIPNGCCSGHRQVARFCVGADVCCFSSNLCNRHQCDVRSKQLACRILEHGRAGLIEIPTSHPSGVTDRASPMLNLLDACGGKPSQRSSFGCPELCKTAPAPGGTTCLSSRMLQFIDSLVVSRFRGLRINSISGGCHECGSKNYNGLAVNMKRQGFYWRFLARCRAMGGKGIDSQANNYINCSFFE